MDENFRVTGKFKPIEEIKETSQTTSSCIILPTQRNNLVQWRRRYGETLEHLSHLDNHTHYQCSHLDADCYIEAIVKACEKNISLSQISDSTYYTFGPVQSINDWSLACEDPGFEFNVEIPIGSSKIYQCVLYISNNSLQLRPRSYLGIGQNSFNFGCQEIGSCYVEEPKFHQNKNSKIIVFPSVLLRTACLKLFNEIISKGSYTDNNDFLKIKLISATTISEGQSESNCNLKGENYLLFRINRMKHEKDRRASQLSSYGVKKIPKPSIMSTEAKKSHSDIRQDSQDSFRITKKAQKTPATKQDKSKLKNSEFIPSSGKVQRDSNMVPSQSEHAVSLQDDNNYFSQFENLIYENKEEQNEALALNDSFQELQKNSNTEEQIEKLKQIRQKKMERESNKSSRVEKLKIKLIDLKIEKEELIRINKKLKVDIDKISSLNNVGNQAQANLLEKTKTQLAALKSQYKNLVESKGKVKQNLQQLHSHKSEQDLHSFGRVPL